VAVVAVRAGSRDRQALFEKPFAVNALAVVLDDIVLGDVVHSGNRSALAVTLAAQVGDVHFVRLGSGVGWRQDVVGAVAFATGGSVSLAAIQRLAVDAGIKVELLFIVAITAINPLELFRVGKLVHRRVEMATRAVEVFVGGFGEDPVVHVQRNRLPGPFGGELGIRVAFQAGLVILGIRYLRYLENEGEFLDTIVLILKDG